MFKVVEIVSARVRQTRSQGTLDSRNETLRAVLTTPHNTWSLETVMAKKLLASAVPPIDIARYIATKQEIQERKRGRDVLSRVGVEILPRPRNERLFYCQEDRTEPPDGSYPPLHVYYMETTHEDEQCAGYFEWLASSGQAGLMMLLGFPTGTLFLRDEDVKGLENLTWQEARKYLFEHQKLLVGHTNEFVRKGPPAESDVNYLVFGEVDCVKLSRYSTAREGTAITITFVTETMSGTLGPKGTIEWQYKYDSRFPGHARCAWTGYGSSSFTKDANNVPAAQVVFAEVADRLLVDGWKWSHKDQRQTPFRDYLALGPLEGDAWFRRAVVQRLVYLAQPGSTHFKPLRVMVMAVNPENTNAETESTIWLNESVDDDPVAIKIELPLTDEQFLTSLHDPIEIANVLKQPNLNLFHPDPDDHTTGLYVGKRLVCMDASEPLFSIPRFFWTSKDAANIADIVTRAACTVLNDNLIIRIQASVWDKVTESANEQGMSMKRLCTPIQPEDFDSQQLPPNLYDVPTLVRGMVDHGVMDKIADELDDCVQPIIGAVLKDLAWTAVSKAGNWAQEDINFSLETLITKIVIGNAMHGPISFVRAALFYAAVRFLNTMLLYGNLQIEVDLNSAKSAWQKYDREWSEARTYSKPQLEIDVKGYFRDFWKDRLDSIKNAQLLVASQNALAKRSDAERKALDQERATRQNFPTLLKQVVQVACEQGARTSVAVSPAASAGSTSNNITVSNRSDVTDTTAENTVKDTNAKPEDATTVDAARGTATGSAEPTSSSPTTTDDSHPSAAAAAPTSPPPPQPQHQTATSQTEDIQASDSESAVPSTGERSTSPDKSASTAQSTVSAQSPSNEDQARAASRSRRPWRP